MFPQGSLGIVHFMHHLQLLIVNSRTSAHTLKRKWQHSCVAVSLNFCLLFTTLNMYFPSTHTQPQSTLLPSPTLKWGARCTTRIHTLLCSAVSDSLRPHGLHTIRLLCRWDCPGKNTGAGFHSLLQGIFPTQGQDLLSLLHCRWVLYS